MTWLSRNVAAVNLPSSAKGSTCTLFSPNDCRVASMLWTRYGFSLASSEGCTLKRCTNAGTATPPRIDTTAQSPTATTGNAQPRRQMFTTNSTHANTEITNSRSIAFSSMFESVYSAPSTVPRVENTNWNRPYQ